MEAQLRATMKQTDSNTGNATSNVERILEKDDRLLDGLEKILPYLSSNNKDLDDTEEVQRLCQALKACTSDEIRSRMDVAYLDAAHATSRQANGINGKPNKLQHQRESLNAELDELCREIDGLSTMAVDNQYLHPIMQANEGAKIDSDASNAAWTDYMSSTLQYLTSRLDFVGEHSLDQREHGKAIKAMSSILEEVLAATADKTKEAELHPRSPTKQTQRGLKPLRLVQANLSDTQDPASQMLRQLDIRNGDTTNSAALAQQVTEAMKEKEMQLSSLRTSSERSMADQIALSLAAVNTDVQSLMRAIFANSHYGTAHTEGDRVRSTMQALEVETQELGEKMREIDVDNISKALRPKQQKWLEQLKQR